MVRIDKSQASMLHVANSLVDGAVKGKVVRSVEIAASAASQRIPLMVKPAQ